MRVAQDQADSLRTPPALDVTARPLSADAPDGEPTADSGTPRAPLLVVASGKGGGGKTFMAGNLAFAFRAMGYHPLLVDMDWGLANVDVALGLAPTRHIGHVLAGDCTLDEAMIEHEGVVILPNGCGQPELAALEDERRSALVGQIETARPDRDFLVFDTHPGIGALTVDVAREARATLIVSTPEPTALTDTYALFKVLGEGAMRGPVGLVINQAGSIAQAHQAASLLDSVSQRFLDRGIASWGYVLMDTAVRQSVQQQRALLSVAPRAEAARLVRQVAGTVAALIDPAGREKQGGGRSLLGGRFGGTRRTAGLGRGG